MIHAILIMLMGWGEKPRTVDVCGMVGTLIIPAALTFGLVRSTRKAPSHG